MSRYINAIESLRGWRLLLVCLLLVTVLRSLTLHAEIIQVDEADNAAQGAVWLAGGTPYVDFVEKKPPLSYAFYALAFAVGGWEMLSVHVAMLLWIALTAMGLFHIARLVGLPRAGPWAALFYATWTVCFPATATLAVNTENMLALPSVWAVYCYLRALRRGGAGWLLLAGGGAAIASLFKHQGGILLVVFVGHLLWLALRERRAIPHAIDALLVGVGFLVPWALTAAAFQAAGALQEALTWNIANNMRYIEASFDVLRFLRRLLLKSGLFAAANIVPTLFAVGALARGIGRGEAWRSLILLWLAGAFVAVMVGGRFSAHYYVQLYPPLLFLAAVGWSDFLARRVTNRSAAVAALVAFFAIPAIWAAVHWASFFGRWFEPQQPVVAELADAIVQHTEEGNRIFVWGYFSYPYYASRRLPAARFVIGEYLVPYWEKKLGGGETFSASELTSWHRNHYEQLMGDLARHRPRVIIDTTGSENFSYWRPFGLEHFPELARMIAEEYEPVATVRGMVVHRRKD